MKKLRVTVDGKVYEVLVEMLDSTASPANAPVAAPTSVALAAVPAPVSPPAAAPAAPPTDGAGSVPCPLAGKVVSIDVKVGDSVRDGTQLVTLEAMKMNTFVYANRSGVVSAINVKPGDAVDEGAALLVIG